MRVMRSLLLAAFVVLPAFGAEKFVLVQGGALGEQRVDDFEVSTHPVTNAEYAEFVQATGHAAPLHWQAGAAPAGSQSHPVIFVNRYDVADYLGWRTRKEGRVYRLPTVLEFEFAARAGDPAAKYPWGSDAPTGKANFDDTGNRTFAQWRQFLKPVEAFAPNRLGLFDMAGNVWQMVDTYPDEAVARFKYRITKPAELEGAITGGSWARTEYYLRCGVRGGASPGIRHPDIGFRVVREPKGTTHFRLEVRRLVALPAGNNQVFLSWQQLAKDTPETGFHIYRSTRRDAAGARITTSPATRSTNYTDASAPAKGRAYYRVRPVGPDGKEGPPSEWAAVEAGSARTGLVMQIEPTAKQGGFLPVFGDLNGDGVLDVALRLDNGIHEMSRDPGVPVELEGFTNYGRSIWRRPLVWHENCFGSSSNVSVVVHDLNGDGKAEVIARVQEEGKVFLAVLDGMTGRTLRRTPWTEMVSDFSKSSTRIHMSVGYLDGKTPAIITQTGLYENEVIDAYDAQLRKLWQYKSLGETNGSGSHHIDIADVDGDGRDEVFNGTMLLNPGGTLRWAIYRQHPDIVSVKHILPGSRDRQVYYVLETSTHAGVYVVDAKSGKVIWKVNREDDPRWTHAHVGWASDIWDGSPGMELFANRDGHLAKETLLYSAEGKLLAEPFPGG